MVRDASVCVLFCEMHRSEYNLLLLCCFYILWSATTATRSCWTKKLKKKKRYDGKWDAGQIYPLNRVDTSQYRLVCARGHFFARTHHISIDMAWRMRCVCAYVCLHFANLKAHNFNLSGRNQERNDVGTWKSAMCTYLSAFSLISIFYLPFQLLLVHISFCLLTVVRSWCSWLWN